LDDLYLLALPRRVAVESRSLALVVDVATRLLTFTTESYGSRAVFATTNVQPHLLEWAVTSRFKVVEVPPPPSNWWSVLKAYGYRVVNDSATSYREALWGTRKPVVELEPLCRRKAWEVDRVTAYSLAFQEGMRFHPLAYELYPDVATRLACSRPVVWLVTPGAVEYLGYYRRPVVIVPPIYSVGRLLELAHEYKATVLSPTAEERLDATQEVAEVCRLRSVNTVDYMNCVRSRVA